VSETPTTKLVLCKSCGARFRIESLKRCPRCRVKINSLNFTKSVEVIPEEQAGNTEVANGRPISQGTQFSAGTRTQTAEERTTHAVRSIAIFILIQVTSSVFSGVFFGIGVVMDMNSEYGDGGGIAMYIIAALIAIGGLIASLNAAWSEYSKSS
jgi:hypothetical protein